MTQHLVQTSIFLESQSGKHRLKIGVSDSGELVVTRLVLKGGVWLEPRPNVGRKNLAVPLGDENLQ